MVSNRERVARALDTTAEASSRSSRDSSPACPGRDGVADDPQVLDERRATIRGGMQYSSGDLQCQLRAMTERIGDLGFPFNEALSRAEQNLAGELRDIRNKSAHRARSTSTTPTVRSTRRSGCFAPPDQPGPADKIKADRVDLQRTQIESETRKDVRESTRHRWPRRCRANPVARRSQAAPRRPEWRFKESEFAANLHSVAHETGTTSEEYSDPVEFFRGPS